MGFSLKRLFACVTLSAIGAMVIEYGLVPEADRQLAARVGASALIMRSPDSREMVEALTKPRLDFVALNVLQTWLLKKQAALQ